MEWKATVDCIFKRLDRIVTNQEFQSWMGNVEAEHLSRTESDHAPLLFSWEEITQQVFKPFRFQKFWTGHESFLDFVKLHWRTDLQGNACYVFKQKVKQIKIALTRWNRDTFGDIFK